MQSKAASRPRWQKPAAKRVISSVWAAPMLLTARMSTRDLLDDLLSQRILLFDGSMGAYIYGRSPQEEDYRGTRFRSHPKLLKNCTDVLVLTQPQLIEDIHRAYLDAGSDIIETCTF